MAVKFEFFLSDEDTERLFAIKAESGKETWTGNEFARSILEKELHRRHPGIVRYDEDGKRIKDK